MHSNQSSALGHAHFPIFSLVLFSSSALLGLLSAAKIDEILSEHARKVAFIDKISWHHGLALLVVLVAALCHCRHVYETKIYDDEHQENKEENESFCCQILENKQSAQTILKLCTFYMLNYYSFNGPGPLKE